MSFFGRIGSAVPMIAAILSTCSSLWAQPFFVSGYGDGIYSSTLKSDGAMTEPVQIAKQASASFFCLHPKLDVLYAVTETMRSSSADPAAVVAYGFDRKSILEGKSPQLRFINSQKVDGDIPCHVAIDATGSVIIISNYINGSVVAFPIKEDGSIAGQSCNIVHELTPGKKASNAHCCAISPGNNWALVADLGLDRVFVYALDVTNGTLTPNKHPHLSLPAGSGPRHLSFHPSGKYVYIINETNLTMASAEWDEEAGLLTLINIESTLPPATSSSGFSTAEVLVHPNGSFVFGSNRGHDSIVTMHIDQGNGTIQRAFNESTQGKIPRNFRLTPDGKLLLAENQISNTIFSFRVNQETGQLTPTGNSIKVEAPACLRFIAEDR